MKKLFVIVAIACAFATSNAQLVQENTPDPATAFEWKQASDGSSLVVLNAWTLAEKYFAIPWGLDFSAGHAVWLGTRTHIANFGEAEAVFGYEIYSLKDVGGDGFFIKGSAGMAIGPRSETRSAFSGYVAIAGGFRF